MQRFSKPLNLFGRPLAVASSPMTASLLTLRPRSTRSQATSRMRKEVAPTNPLSRRVGNIGHCLLDQQPLGRLAVTQEDPVGIAALAHPSLNDGRARALQNSPARNHHARNS